MLECFSRLALSNWTIIFYINSSYWVVYSNASLALEDNLAKNKYVFLPHIILVLLFAIFYAPYGIVRTWYHGFYFIIYAIISLTSRTVYSRQKVTHTTVRRHVYIGWKVTSGKIIGCGIEARALYHSFLFVQYPSWDEPWLSCRGFPVSWKLHLFGLFPYNSTSIETGNDACLSIPSASAFVDRTGG